MEWYNRLKGALGFPSHQNSTPTSRDDRFIERYTERDNNQHVMPFGSDSFNIFTDPIEMHRYFEQQVEQIFKAFQFGDSKGLFGDSGSEEDGPEEFFSFEYFDSNSDHDHEPSNLRDQFLKGGPKYEIETNPGNRQDTDLDGKLSTKEWDSLFSKSPSKLVPRDKIQVFSKSSSSSSVTRSDGIIETRRVMKDNAGNEETTISRRIGDKEHTVIKRRDKDGKEEIVENFINVDQKDVNKYFPQSQDTQSSGRTSDWFKIFF